MKVESEVCFGGIAANFAFELASVLPLGIFTLPGLSFQPRRGIIRLQRLLTRLGRLHKNGVITVMQNFKSCSLDN